MSGFGIRWLAWVCLALASAAAQATCSAPLRMGMMADWEPYNFTDARGRASGLDVEMARAIFAEAGCTLVEIGPLSAGRAAGLFYEGKIDLLLGASRTAEREPIAHFTRRYRGESVAIFTLADAGPASRGVASFAQFLQQPGLLLAPRIGWFGQDYAKHQASLRQQGRLAEFAGYSRGLSQLAARRAPYLLGDTLTIDRAAARMGLKVRALPFLLLEAPVYIMFSKKSVSPADVARIDEAVARLEKKGVLERMRRAYAASE